MNNCLNNAELITAWTLFAKDSLEKYNTVLIVEEIKIVKMIHDLMNTIIKILYQMKPSRQDIGKFEKISGGKSFGTFIESHL